MRESQAQSPWGVGALWQSPTLRSVLVFGASGLGFAGANLILARYLPTAEYGIFTLVTALMNLGHALAPVGLDRLVNRRQLEGGTALLGHTLGAALMVGGVFLVIAGTAYQVTAPLLIILLAAIVGGGPMMVAGALFQSQRRYGLALAITQSPNLALLVAALVVIVSGEQGAWLPLAIAALGFVSAAVYGWWSLFREQQREPRHPAQFAWNEALSLAGLNAAALLLVQLDRLMIPHVLELRDLATFGVLAAIAGSFFRVLQMGVGFTLLPRLRGTTSTADRRHLIAHEARLVGAAALLGSAAIWLVIPLVEVGFLQGKYHLSNSLLLAALVSGIAKILNSFSQSIVTVLAVPAELMLMNVWNWISVLLAIVAAVFAARWGLAGVVYAVGLGWLLPGTAALVVAWRHLKPTAAASTSPS